ncbi:hypothetical protein HRR84_003804 [Exophiala dermatitidis]|nr:hypothetical protein HRR84_003804 [Exophiala dermatitidis]
MAGPTPQKRVLPPRERRDATAKRRASSPVQTPAATSSARRQSTPTQPAESRPKRKYTKRSSFVRIQTPSSRASSTPAAVVEETLPTRLNSNEPLPTLKDKQDRDLNLNEYQSIAESAVLSASLHRSRMQWLVDGVFQKYWVKPVKRKGVVEAPPNNPDVKSMQKLGIATITIEPHTFDAVFYTVRDPAGPQPYQRHANQHTTKHMIPPQSPYGATPPPIAFQRSGTHAAAPAPPFNHSPAGPIKASSPSTQPKPHLPSTPSYPNTPSQPATPQLNPQPATPQLNHGTQPLPARTDQPGGPIGPPAPAAVSVKQEEAPRPVSASLQSTPSVQPPPPAAGSTNAPSSATTPTPGPSQKPSQPPGGKGSTTDPVIQMLAARAASDHKLKELMKIVATSKASAEQLKEFQAHIDEFNEVVRKQEAERVARNQERSNTERPSNALVPAVSEASKEGKAVPAPSPSTLAQTPKQSPAPTAAQSSVPKPTHGQQRQPPPSPGPAAFPGVIHTFTPAPQRPSGPGGPMGGFMGYPPPPRPEPIVKHIVMELTSIPGSGQSPCQDRWLFPEHAVLEIRYGGLEMICSFFVERKGSEILSRQGAGAAENENSAMRMKWKAEQEYYQPVTMTVKATNHRTIETIARAAKPLPLVQSYMKNVMDKKERAPTEYLAYQLPREGSTTAAEGSEPAFVDSGVELGSESCSEDDELKDVYGI